ncbi:MAG: F-type H+-transporting ATPase subunit b [Paraglaciecola sp.]|jgi:F-type H+-transporting ATPase subunit b
MPIDWFTVVAQTTNFLILVWLLKRFLYHPILDGLDAREQKIKKILEDADARNMEAQELKTDLEHERQQIKKQRMTILNKVNAEATTQRQQLFEAAQAAADDMLRKRLEALQKEIQSLQHDLVQKNVMEVYATSRKILHDLAGIDIEECMLGRLLNQLKNLKTEQYGELLAAMDRSNYSVLVRSAFELNVQQKKAIQLCIQNKFSGSSGKPVKLSFNHVPAFINGIELSASGWKIAWSCNNYLAELQQRVSELSNQKITERPYRKALNTANV